MTTHSFALLLVWIQDAVLDRNRNSLLVHVASIVAVIYCYRTGDVCSHRTHILELRVNQTHACVSFCNSRFAFDLPDKSVQSCLHLHVSGSILAKKGVAAELPPGLSSWATLLAAGRLFSFLYLVWSLSSQMQCDRGVPRLCTDLLLCLSRAVSIPASSVH